MIERPSIVKSISTGSLVERGAATDGGARNPLPEGRWAQVSGKGWWGSVERWWDGGMSVEGW